MVDKIIPLRAGTFKSQSQPQSQSQSQSQPQPQPQPSPGIVDELVGGDLMEHNILHPHIGVTEALDTLRWNMSDCIQSTCFFTRLESLA